MVEERCSRQEHAASNAACDAVVAYGLFSPALLRPSTLGELQISVPIHPFRFPLLPGRSVVRDLCADEGRRQAIGFAKPASSSPSDGSDKNVGMMVRGTGPADKRTNPSPRQLALFPSCSEQLL